MNNLVTRGLGFGGGNVVTGGLGFAALVVGGPITRLSHDGYMTRRYGLFVGKGVTIISSIVKKRGFTQNVGKMMK